MQLSLLMIQKLKKLILHKTGRGVTYWMGKGAFTETETEILLCVLNRYEVHAFRKMVAKQDPKAFILLSKGNQFWATLKNV